MKEHLDLEDSNNCQSDGLTLTALHPRTHQIGKYCGQRGTILKQIKTDAHDVIIVFNFGFVKFILLTHYLVTVTNPSDSSDLAGSFTGFRLHYTTEQTGSLCQGVHQEFKPRGTLKSVHIPEKYTRMLTCSWIITTPSPDKAVTVQITHMKISDDCEKDYVSIIDGKSQADREVARLVSIVGKFREITCQSPNQCQFILRAVGIFQSDTKSLT